MIGNLSDLVSHVKRLCNRFVPEPTPKVVVGLPVVKRKVDEKSGRVVNYVEFEVDDKVSRLSQYKVSDFALENLIAADVPLDPVMLRSSGISVADGLTNTVNELSVKYPKMNDYGENS